MVLNEALIEEHSRAQTQKIFRWISDDAERFAALAELFLNGDGKIVQRAAPVIGLVAEHHPEIVLPFLPRIVARMEDPKQHGAVRRNVMRIFERLQVPEALEGRVMHLAFHMLADHSEAIAVRAHAMSVLAGLARTYPDIRGELELLITDIMAGDGATAALRARGRMVLKELARRLK